MSEPITTRVFMSGDSQAVRIPRSLGLRGPDVSIARRDDEILIREAGQPGSLGEAFDLIACLPETIDDRADDPPRDREGL